MFERIPGNVLEDSGGMFEMIPGNVREESGECLRKFRGI